ncbi:MAG: SET domain-containing protein-lysine N-methyltransferase [Bryobacteraceae bacterium]
MSGREHHGTGMEHKPIIDQRHACFRLRVGPSTIHRWGVYAAESIPANRKVLEYTGERISRRETKKRSERPLNYIFTLDAYWSIDGSVGGSGAEFINHCCDPNVFSRIVRGHILYYSARPIRKGEELTVDYRFEKHVEKVPCACGSAKCRGTINLK